MKIGFRRHLRSADLTAEGSFRSVVELAAFGFGATFLDAPSGHRAIESRLVRLLDGARLKAVDIGTIRV